MHIREAAKLVALHTFDCILWQSSCCLTLSASSHHIHFPDLLKSCAKMPPFLMPLMSSIFFLPALPQLQAVCRTACLLLNQLLPPRRCAAHPRTGPPGTAQHSRHYQTAHCHGLLHQYKIYDTFRKVALKTMSTHKRVANKLP